MITQDLLLQLRRDLNLAIAGQHPVHAIHLLHAAGVRGTQHLKANNLPQSAVFVIKAHKFTKISVHLLLQGAFTKHSLLQALHEGFIFFGYQLIKKLLLIAKIFIDCSLANIGKRDNFVQGCLLIAVHGEDFLRCLKDA